MEQVKLTPSKNGSARAQDAETPAEPMNASDIDYAIALEEAAGFQAHVDQADAGDADQLAVNKIEKRIADNNAWAKKEVEKIQEQLRSRNEPLQKQIELIVIASNQRAQEYVIGFKERQGRVAGMRSLRKGRRA